MTDEEFLPWLEASTLSDRQKLAAAMRAKGATLREIGAALGVSTGHAWAVVALAQRAFERREAKAKKLRRLEDKSDWRGLTGYDLDVSVRAANVVSNTGTLGDIADMTDAELLRLPNCGRKTLLELRSVIRSFTDGA